MSSQIEEFFRKDGAIGLIVSIGPDKARFTEIESQVAVSHDTISKRIDEARELGLIDTEPVSDVGTAYTNKLTKSGEVCYGGMVRLGLADAHTDYVDALKKYDELSNEYTQQVGEEKKWLEWVTSDEIVIGDLMTRFEIRGEGNTRVDTSRYPEAVQEALRQQSVDPLQDIDNKQYWLWRLMRYPPEPEDYPSPSHYTSDSEPDNE